MENIAKCVRVAKSPREEDSDAAAWLDEHQLFLAVDYGREPV